MILVGEMRDAETARIAVQSALTGHFVLSSVHATDTATALHRLLDMGIETFLVASSVSAVVSQRLIRRICENCREYYEPPAPEQAFLRSTGAGVPLGGLVRGAGCDRCAHTGYLERTGVYELMPITDTIRELVVERAPLAEIRKTATLRGHADSAGGGRPAGPGRCHHGRGSRPVDLHGGDAMTRYSYVAVELDGSTKRGTTRADSREDAELALYERELRNIRLTEKPGLLKLEITARRVKREEVMHLTRQLGAFVQAGMPLTESVHSLGREADNSTSAG